jgi:hypothetical protein
MSSRLNARHLLNTLPRGGQTIPYFLTSAFLLRHLLCPVAYFIPKSRLLFPVRQSISVALTNAAILQLRWVEPLRLKQSSSPNSRSAPPAFRRCRAAPRTECREQKSWPGWKQQCLPSKPYRREISIDLLEAGDCDSSGEAVRTLEYPCLYLHISALYWGASGSSFFAEGNERHSSRVHPHILHSLKSEAEAE